MSMSFVGRGFSFGEKKFSLSKSFKVFALFALLSPMCTTVVNAQAKTKGMVVKCVYEESGLKVVEFNAIGCKEDAVKKEVKDIAVKPRGDKVVKMPIGKSTNVSVRY